MKPKTQEEWDTVARKLGVATESQLKQLLEEIQKAKMLVKWHPKKTKEAIVAMKLSHGATNIMKEILEKEAK